MKISELKPLKESIHEVSPNDALTFKLVELLSINQDILYNFYQNDRKVFNQIKEEILAEFFFKFKRDFELLLKRGDRNKLAYYLVLIESNTIKRELCKKSTLIINDEYFKKIEDFKQSLTPKKGCYIATMAYGNYNHPQVIELREFRDDFLSKTVFGKVLIKLYYKYSPSLVEKLKDKQNLNQIIRKVLDKFIVFINIFK